MEVFPTPNLLFSLKNKHLYAKCGKVPEFPAMIT